MGDRDRAVRTPEDGVPDDALPADARPSDARTRAHGPGWLRLRLALGVLWAAVAVAVLLLTPHERAAGDLLVAVEQGRVDQVTLTGGVGPDGEGWSLVQVTWREGGLLRRAELVEERGAEAEQDARYSGSSGYDEQPDAYVVEDVASSLRTAAPGDLRLTREPWPDGTHLFHVPVPGPVALAFALLWLLSLALLMEGPRPWRATRWAWFWLSPVPFGVLLFVLLSGPLPGRRWSTEPVGRRLTGGWAFLLTVVLSSVLPAPLWW